MALISYDYDSTAKLIDKDIKTLILLSAISKKLQPTGPRRIMLNTTRAKVLNIATYYTFLRQSKNYRVRQFEGRLSGKRQTTMIDFDRLASLKAGSVSIPTFQDNVGRDISRMAEILVNLKGAVLEEKASQPSKPAFGPKMMPAKTGEIVFPEYEPKKKRSWILPAAGVLGVVALVLKHI